MPVFVESEEREQHKTTCLPPRVLWAGESPMLTKFLNGSKAGFGRPGALAARAPKKLQWTKSMARQQLVDTCWRTPLENSVGEPRSVPFDPMAYSRLICIHVSHIIFGVTCTCNFQEFWVSLGNLRAHESKVLCQMLQQQRQLECSEC